MRGDKIWHFLSQRTSGLNSYFVMRVIPVPLNNDGNKFKCRKKLRHAVLGRGQGHILEASPPPFRTRF